MMYAADAAATDVFWVVHANGATAAAIRQKPLTRIGGAFGQVAVSLLLDLF